VNVCALIVVTASSKQLASIIFFIFGLV